MGSAVFYNDNYFSMLNFCLLSMVSALTYRVVSLFQNKL